MLNALENTHASYAIIYKDWNIGQIYRCCKHELFFISS